MSHGKDSPRATRMDSAPADGLWLESRHHQRRENPVAASGQISACVLLTLMLISTGVLFSTMFAKSAVAVAVNFAATVLYTFCCFCNIGMFPMMLLMPMQPGDDGMRVVILAFTVAIYSVIVATVLAVAVGLFEQRAREAA